MRYFFGIVKRDNIQKMVTGAIPFFEERLGKFWCEQSNYSFSYPQYKTWLVKEVQASAQFFRADVVAFSLAVPDNVSELTREVLSANIDTLKIWVDAKAETGELLNQGFVTRLQDWLLQGNSVALNPESLSKAEAAVGNFTGYAELINNPPILNAYNVLNERSGSGQEDETLAVEHANKKVHKSY